MIIVEASKEITSVIFHVIRIVNFSHKFKELSNHIIEMTTIVRLNNLILENILLFILTNFLSR